MQQVASISRDSPSVAIAQIKGADVFAGVIIETDAVMFVEPGSGAERQNTLRVFFIGVLGIIRPKKT